MKRFLLMLLSLVMVLGSLGVMPMVSAEGEAEATILPENYEFFDIAHKTNADGSTTYVAAAKNFSGTTYPIKLYSSADGVNWTEGNVTIDSGAISANQRTQQQLVFWEGQNCFVVKGTSKTYTSSDGKAWAENTNIQYSSNALLASAGEQLILVARNHARVTSTATTKELIAYDEFDGKTESSYYAKAIGVTKPDAEGNVSVFVDGNNIPFDLKVSADNVWDKTATKSNSGATAGTPYDMVYNEKAKQFVSINGSKDFYVAADSQHCTKITVEKAVTGIGISDKYIVTGMSDGTMYYTANSEQGITAETVWTQISAESGTTVCTEPVKNIEFSDDEHFIALSTTQIYKGNVRHYANVREYRALEKPQISKENVFQGVRLIGGTYANVNGQATYIVYGDTAVDINDDTTIDPNNTSAAANRKGKIFTSTDGVNWEETYSGKTFTKAVKNSSGAISYTEVRNGAVWWESQGHFIISASTQTHTGVSFVSEDGKTWTEKQPATTDFRMNTDIAIAGDKLYTTDNGRQFRTYTAWDKGKMKYVGLTTIANGEVPGADPGKWYLNQIAVSDEESPAVLETMSNGVNAVVRDNTLTDEELSGTTDDDKERSRWKKLSASTAGVVTDAVYSDQLKKFVALSTSGDRTSIIDVKGNKESGPIVAGGIVLNAVDTNGREFMFAGADGNIYTVPDTAEFAKDVTPLVKVSTASGTAENTMNVTNVFKAGADAFIATASNNTDSDVLVIKKNGSAYEYTKASDNSKAESIVPGDTVNVSVKGINLRANEYPFTMVTAVYATDGTLLQSQTDGFEIPAQSSGTTVTTTVKWSDDLPADAEVRVFLWDSMNGMVPLHEVAVNPF